MAPQRSTLESQIWTENQLPPPNVFEYHQWTQSKPACSVARKIGLHPWKLTWNPKMKAWNMIFLFKALFFKFHVNFRGSTPNKWTFDIFRQWQFADSIAISECQSQLNSPQKSFELEVSCHSYFHWLLVDFTVSGSLHGNCWWKGSSLT